MKRKHQLPEMIEPLPWDIWSIIFTLIKQLKYKEQWQHIFDYVLKSSGLKICWMNEAIDKMSPKHDQFVFPDSLVNVYGIKGLIWDNNKNGNDKIDALIGKCYLYPDDVMDSECIYRLSTNFYNEYKPRFVFMYTRKMEDMVTLVPSLPGKCFSTDTIVLYISTQSLL